MQIYESILDFKHRAANPYNYKLQYAFRYNSFQPLSEITNMKPLTILLYAYILSNLCRYLINKPSDIESVLERSMTIDLHPIKVKIARQHIKTYLDELVGLNFISKAGERGYEYYVNPYYYNVLSKPLAEYCFAGLLPLVERLPLVYPAVELDACSVSSVRMTYGSAPLP